jgi:hypothetical protein
MAKNGAARMGELCGTMRDIRNVYTILVGKVGRDHLAGVGLSGRIILKWI